MNGSSCTSTDNEVVLYCIILCIICLCKKRGLFFSHFPMGEPSTSVSWSVLIQQNDCPSMRLEHSFHMDVWALYKLTSLIIITIIIIMYYQCNQATVDKMRNTETVVVLVIFVISLCSYETLSALLMCQIMDWYVIYFGLIQMMWVSNPTSKPYYE